MLGWHIFPRNNRDARIFVIMGASSTKQQDMRNLPNRNKRKLFTRLLEGRQLSSTASNQNLRRNSYVPCINDYEETNEYCFQNNDSIDRNTNEPNVVEHFPSTSYSCETRFSDYFSPKCHENSAHSSIHENYRFLSRQRRRPLIRSHSLNYNYRKLRNNQQRLPVRYNSLSCIHYETNYNVHRNSLINYDNDEIIFQNCPSYDNSSKRSFQDFNVTLNPEKWTQRSTGVKRSYNEYDDDDYNDHWNNSCSEKKTNSSCCSLNNESGEYTGPYIKRRHSCNSFEGSNYSLNNYTKVIEISHQVELKGKGNVFVSGETLPQTGSSNLKSMIAQNVLHLPFDWPIVDGGKVRYVKISFSSDEGQKVLRFFQRSSFTKDFYLKITGVTKIESPFLQMLYLLRKEEMISRNGHVDELLLYHGTKKELLSTICEDNLNWRMHSERHRFGQGVSFSPLATYSSHYSDKSNEKVMLLFKVLVSSSIIGSPQMVIPPNINGAVCDTSIKDDTTVVVKYCDNEFYPLYLINYKNTARDYNKHDLL